MFREAVSRKEGELIPQGVSITETASVFYAYIRVGDDILVLKFPRDAEGDWMQEFTTKAEG